MDATARLGMILELDTSPVRQGVQSTIAELRKMERTQQRAERGPGRRVEQHSERLQERALRLTQEQTRVATLLAQKNQRMGQNQARAVALLTQKYGSLDRARQAALENIAQRQARIADLESKIAVRRGLANTTLRSSLNLEKARLSHARLLLKTAEQEIAQKKKLAEAERKAAENAAHRAALAQIETRTARHQVLGRALGRPGSPEHAQVIRGMRPEGLGARAGAFMAGVLGRPHPAVVRERQRLVQLEQKLVELRERATRQTGKQREITRALVRTVQAAVSVQQRKLGIMERQNSAYKNIVASAIKHSQQLHQQLNLAFRLYVLFTAALWSLMNLLRPLRNMFRAAQQVFMRAVGWARQIGSALVGSLAEIQSLEGRMNVFFGERTGEAVHYAVNQALGKPFEWTTISEGMMKAMAMGVDKFGSEALPQVMDVAMDVAAAFGRPVADASMAIMQATVGNWQRMIRSFGFRPGEAVAYGALAHGDGEQLISTTLEDQARNLKAILAMMTDRVGGAADALNMTWKAMIEDMKDIWTSFALFLYESGMLRPFLQLLGSIRANFVALREAGALRIWAQQLATAFGWIREPLEWIGDRLPGVALAVVTFFRIAGERVGRAYRDWGGFSGILEKVREHLQRALPRALEILASYLEVARGAMFGLLQLARIGIEVFRTLLGVLQTLGIADTKQAREGLGKLTAPGGLIHQAEAGLMSPTGFPQRTIDRVRGWEGQAAGAEGAGNWGEWISRMFPGMGPQIIGAYQQGIMPGSYQQFGAQLEAAQKPLRMSIDNQKATMDEGFEGVEDAIRAQGQGAIDAINGLREATTRRVGEPATEAMWGRAVGFRIFRGMATPPPQLVPQVAQAAGGFTPAAPTVAGGGIPDYFREMGATTQKLGKTLEDTQKQLENINEKIKNAWWLRVLVVGVFVYLLQKPLRALWWLLRQLWGVVVTVVRNWDVIKAASFAFGRRLLAAVRWIVGLRGLIWNAIKGFLGRFIPGFGREASRVRPQITPQQYQAQEEAIRQIPRQLRGGGVGSRGIPGIQPPGVRPPSGLGPQATVGMGTRVMGVVGPAATLASRLLPWIAALGAASEIIDVLGRGEIAGTKLPWGPLDPQVRLGWEAERVWEEAERQRQRWEAERQRQRVDVHVYDDRVEYRVNDSHQLEAIRQGR